MRNLIVFLVVALVLGTSTTVLALAGDANAGRGRWTPALGDTISFNANTGAAKSQMNPEYDLESFTCTVVENTDESGFAKLNCDFYGELPSYQQ